MSSNRFLSSFVGAEKQPLLPHIPPVQMLWHPKLYNVQVECFLFVLREGFSLHGCLHRFSRENNRSRGLGPVNKTST